MSLGEQLITSIDVYEMWKSDAYGSARQITR